MGHKTIQMTRRYAHLAPAHQLAAVERLISYAVLPQPVAGSTEAPSATGREDDIAVDTALVR